MRKHRRQGAAYRPNAKKQNAAQPAAMRENARDLATRGARAFRSDADVLKAARTLFALRQSVCKETDTAVYREGRRMASAATRSLHASVKATTSGPYLASVLRAGCRTNAEREIVLALCLSSLAMSAIIGDVEDLMAELGLDAGEGLSVMKALGRGSRLASRGIVEIDDDEECEFSRANVALLPSVLEPMLSDRASTPSRWAVRSYPKLLHRMGVLFESLARLDITQYSSLRGPGHRGQQRPEARARRLIKEVRDAAARHPEWPINEVFLSNFSDPELKILLILLGKEYNFAAGETDMYKGQGLARCASRGHGQTQEALACLRSKGRLRTEQFIAPIGGGEALAGHEDEETLRAVEFELTKEFRERLKVERKQRSGAGGRRPTVRMSQLVLHDEARRALSMVAAQATHARVMLDDWGLARRIAYGRGVTALFYGPPGTGKTASAEAIAHELDRPICVVDYSKIQSCWVGETEKNITRAFSEAARAGAVLFWDEADAMFYDRDDASRSWEVRDVNVLLQRIERFEGLCILSTNRHATLDKAFERRISLKIEFAPPDRAMRAGIWRKLLPPKMPLGRDVNLAALAEHDLTGGEIKNVVMNTARLAVCRGADATVTDADFTEAVRMELDGRWSAKGQMGFACASASAE